MSFNRAIIMGNIGRDPEVNSMNNGDQVANFSVATTERWTDKGSGQKKEAVEWHNVVCFNQNLIKFIEQYLEKGSSVLVEGQIKTRSWEKDGVKQYRTEIVIGRFNGSVTFAGGKGQGGGGGGDRDEHSYGTTRDRDVDRGQGFDAGQSYGGGGSGGLPDDEEIPFATMYSLR